MSDLSSQRTSEVQTVLLVDDEVSILKALRRTLKREGYQVLMAESGSQGIEMLSQHPGIGVVITDFRMPGMDGVELLEAIAGRFPDVTCLMLSGQAETKKVVGAMMDGVMMEFLSKPWSDQELLGHVAAAFSQRQPAPDSTA